MQNILLRKAILITIIATVMLVGCGPSVDIHQAAKDGNIEAVKQHLAASVDVNAKDRFNKTPLYRAASAGRSEIVRVLIANGAGVNVKDAKGETPLDEAERIIEDTTDPHSLEYKAAKKRTAPKSNRKFLSFTY